MARAAFPALREVYWSFDHRKSNRQELIPMNKQFLAFLCRICPFCCYARKHPDSGFAHKLRAAEQNCPACKAYSELYGAGHTPEDRPQQ